MKTSWTLTGSERGLLGLTYRQGGSQRVTAVRPVYTVMDVCRRLRKSRRQVYRYLRAGRLQPCGRILGQWLFASAQMDGFARNTLPRGLRRFFWDVRLADLSTEQHQNFILARLLESGDWQALRWVFQTYPRKALTTFLQDRGVALLSRRAWHFWSVQLGLKPRARSASWRHQGRAWGGVQ